MAIVSMKTFLETGVHFGHRTRKWNPKMRPYIFTERNGIHIIDLQQTLQRFEEIYEMLRDEVAKGKVILFVGTKRQAQDSIIREAQRCGMPYVTNRWLGGMLTNWTTMKERIKEMERLEEMQTTGEINLLTKKEGLQIRRKIDKLDDRFGGIRKMEKLPDYLFVVDVRREETAVREANILNIPVIAMVDTNCDPTGVDYVIPSNDDAIRAIKLMVGKIADAVIEGKMMGGKVGGDDRDEDAGAITGLDDLQIPTGPESDLQDEEDDENLLGAATLAKLQGNALDFGDTPKAAEEQPADAQNDSPDAAGDAATKTNNETTTKTESE